MAVHCCGFCCRSFSTWWAIVGLQAIPLWLILLLGMVAKVKNQHHFYVRQHICYSAYMLSPVRPSVCPSVCHTGVS